MYKKGLAATMLSLALVAGVGFGQNGSVNAMESTSEIEEVNFVAEATEDEATLSTSPLLELNPFAGFTISTTNLKPGTYIQSRSSYYIKKNEKVSVVNVAFSPRGQKIKLGFVSTTNSKDQYWTPAHTGGSVDISGFTLGGPTGDYYIAIQAVSSNTANLTSVTGNFDF